MFRKKKTDLQAIKKLQKGQENYQIFVKTNE